MLDIIVTHCNEPWELGKPFFDMLQYQSCIDYDDIHVILVQDGTEGNLLWAKLLGDYDYEISLYTIQHSGTASARNAGLSKATHDWVTFCDFDDHFADVCAIRMFLSMLPTDGYDLIWGKYVQERLWGGLGPSIQCVSEATLSSTDCKFYRRDMLMRNGIRFNPATGMHYDYAFNQIVTACIAPFRIAMLTTDFYLYVKTYRPGGMRQSLSGSKEYIQTVRQRDLAILQEFRKRGMDVRAAQHVAFIVYSEYFRLYHPDSQEKTGTSPEFIRFWNENGRVFYSVPETEREVIKDQAEAEAMSLIQDMYNKHKLEYFPAHDNVTFDQWLDTLKRQTAEEQTDNDGPVIIPNDPYTIENAEQVEEDREVRNGNGQERVVVYCGTYNVYQSMVASCKSLLANTRVDRVYFLTEDDTFPYELPDIVTNINVKNQKYFPESGPNYSNPWSYMCMMRAAFTKLIPYEKVLSLDIDVIINEDIGCLWDIDMTDYYLAGVPEPQRQKSSDDPIYINFGVVMMNLAKLRADGIDTQVIAALNKEKFGCPEQDAFNRFCARHIYRLPNDYNATVHSHITGEYERERIIHYAGIRFWRHFGPVKEYAERKWQDIMEQQERLRTGAEGRQECEEG